METFQTCLVKVGVWLKKFHAATPFRLLSSIFSGSTNGVAGIYHAWQFGDWFVAFKCCKQIKQFSHLPEKPSFASVKTVSARSNILYFLSRAAHVLECTSLVFLTTSAIQNTVLLHVHFATFKCFAVGLEELLDIQGFYDFTAKRFVANCMLRTLTKYPIFSACTCGCSLSVITQDS